MIMYFSPLEQFTIISLVPFHLGNFYFSFTNSALFFLLSTGAFIFLCSLVFVKGGNLVPTPWQSLIELIYEFVVSLVSEQIGKKGCSILPFCVHTFYFFTFK